MMFVFRLEHVKFSFSVINNEIVYKMLLMGHIVLQSEKGIVSVHALKGYEGTEALAPLILKLGARWRRVVNRDKEHRVPMTSVTSVKCNRRK
jgi:malonyl CoA-acyl carrier protein transacylase